MRIRRLIALFAAGTIMLACNFPMLSPATEPAKPPVTLPTATDTAGPAVPTMPSATAAPDATLTPTTVPTPSTPQVTPNAVNVNCRSGPDTAYDAVSVLMFGSWGLVAGRSEDSNWWYIHDPSNSSSFCWVAASVVTIAGPQGGIAIIAPPAPIVSNVTVGVDVPSTVYCGGPNPVSFSGSITTTGATKVKYQWEITGDKENTTSPQTLNFSSGGTKDAADPGAYSVDCGTYKITLHILSPNDVSATKKFKIAP